jgi:hypothetical protein
MCTGMRGEKEESQKWSGESSSPVYGKHLVFVAGTKGKKRRGERYVGKERGRSRNLSRLSRLKVPAYDREACKQKPNVPLKLIACLSS